MLYYLTELMFLPRIYERTEAPMKEEYITEINNLLPLADEELLDFVFQLLQKSIKPSETHLQPA
jgi:hypothetical protein